MANLKLQSKKRKYIEVEENLKLMSQKRMHIEEDENSKLQSKKRMYIEVDETAELRASLLYHKRPDPKKNRSKWPPSIIKKVKQANELLRQAAYLPDVGFKCRWEALNRAYKMYSTDNILMGFQELNKFSAVMARDIDKVRMEYVKYRKVWPSPKTSQHTRILIL